MDTRFDKDIEAFLGRPPTESERAIAADQAARVESGIFANPLLEPPGQGPIRLRSGTGALVAIDPFSAPEADA
ncbi:hypothetical protein [Allosediminivita pacifica]|uniref:Uncharacterized protein n=1 Tax=Allosediminivita pacifica TaxID=1267769 RepID=A0A2T6AQ60_9RHOB|nr:hypothetical protein [Allosediminivita pacifica]PTX45876.1 hypothetical protein C8N44_11934 [Allosediminivita pacifica]GGB19448.1 hypothetical protein GCM10011324_31980 [Allosediminivita pacifica]